jgi:acetyl-CoA acetyltransferase
MSDDAARTPVIVGVGQLNDRPKDPRQGLDPAGLMEAALREADRDGGTGWIARLDSLAVVDQLSFRELGDVSRPLAARLGAKPKLCYKSSYPGGDTPILMLNEAARRIVEGEIQVAAVAGGEALRTAAQLAALRAGDDPSAHNPLRQATSRAGPPSLRQRYGLIAPVDVYPLYENAGRAAYGQTLTRSPGRERRDLVTVLRGRCGEPRRLDPQTGHAGGDRDPLGGQQADRLPLQQADGRQLLGEPGRRVHRRQPGRRPPGGVP